MKQNDCKLPLSLLHNYLKNCVSRFSKLFFNKSTGQDYLSLRYGTVSLCFFQVKIRKSKFCFVRLNNENKLVYTKKGK